MNDQYIFWFGAGVSIPSGMPSGWDLTDEWLKFYLPADEYTFIRNFYQKQKNIIGKDLPRLEKIIGDSIEVYGTDCLKVLDFMREISPNNMHLAIANYIANNQTYAFTTNFDLGIEKANNKIRISSPTSNNLENWGLIKLHGCIQENHNKLGITIKKLQNGLNNSVNTLISNLLMQENNIFVFLGYSASDYFDIVPFFQSFYLNNQFFKAKVIWIQHIVNVEHTIDITESYSNELKWYEKEMLASFNKENISVLKGKTEKALLNLIPGYFSYENYQIGYDWKNNWSKHIKPTLEQRRKLAVNFYSSIGYGKKCLSLLKIPANINFYNTDIQIYLNSLRDCGYYESELYLRKKLKRYYSDFSKTYFIRHYCSSLRLSGRNMHTFIMYTFYLIMFLNARYFVHKEDEHNSALCLIAESGLFYQSILYKIPRNLILVIFTLPLEHAIRKLMSLSISLYKKYSDLYNGKNDSSLKAIVNRVNDLLTIPIFQSKHFMGLLNKLDYLHKNTLDFTDFSDLTYIEMDSFLGVTNFNRNRAYNNIRYLQLGIFQPKNNEFNKRMYSEISDAINTSLIISKYIKDIPGQIKAYKILSLLSLFEKDYLKYQVNNKKYKILNKILLLEDNKLKKLEKLRIK